MARDDSLRRSGNAIYTCTSFWGFYGSTFMTHKFHEDLKNSPNNILTVSTTVFSEPSAVSPPSKVCNLQPSLIFPENTMTCRRSSLMKAQHSSHCTSLGTAQSTFYQTAHLLRARSTPKVLSTKNLKLKLPCQKLSPRYIESFKIVHQIYPVTYWLQLPYSYRISPSFRVTPQAGSPLPSY